MSDPNQLEVYKQRYETYRHLDKLRWQLLTVLGSIFSAAAIVLRATSGPTEWWFSLALGVSLLFIAWLIFRINTGIIQNQKVLRKAGQAIGDDAIPDVSNRWLAASHWLVMVSGLSGIAFVLWGINTLAQMRIFG